MFISKKETNIRYISFAFCIYPIVLVVVSNKLIQISCHRYRLTKNSHDCRWSLFLPRRFLPALPPQAAISALEVGKHPEHNPRSLCHVSQQCWSNGGEAETERLEGILGASEGVDKSRRWTSAVVFAVRLQFPVGQFSADAVLARSVIVSYF